MTHPLTPPPAPPHGCRWILTIAIHMTLADVIGTTIDDTLKLDWDPPLRLWRAEAMHGHRRLIATLRPTKDPLHTTLTVTLRDGPDVLAQLLDTIALPLTDTKLHWQIDRQGSSFNIRTADFRLSQ